MGHVWGVPSKPWAQGRRAKTADLAFLLAFCPYHPFLRLEWREGGACAGRMLASPSPVPEWFSRIYVSGHVLARNFWDPGKASNVFASNPSPVARGVPSSLG